MNVRKLADWRKLLIYTHRWMGIAGSLLFVTWFFSGIMMLYWGMPSLTTAERLSYLEPLDFSTATITPAEAAHKAGIRPSTLKIGMYYDGRPVYRFENNIVVYADTGEVVHGRSADQAMELVRTLAPQNAATIRYDAWLEDSDQWTLLEGPHSQTPLHRIALGDAKDTYFYVSQKTGEPVQKTDRDTRFWGFLSAVLHYVYIPSLKRRGNLWNGFIVWGSLAGCVMSVLGLVTGVWRFSTSGRFRQKGQPSHSPYAGWMRWHHYAGLLFGFFSFTWILSGGMSINPYGWFSSTTPTSAQRRAMSGGEFRLKDLTLADMHQGIAAISKHLRAKEADVVQFRSGLYLTTSRTGKSNRAAQYFNVSLAHPELGASPEFDRAVLPDIAREAMPGATIQDAIWLSEPDNYYKNRDSGGAPLAVFRVRYNDADQTWLYFDAQRGLIASKQDRITRTRRWLYNGLHSFDVPWLNEHRVVKDTAMILLSLGGLFLSGSSLLPAVRRVGRHGRRFVNWVGARVLRLNSESLQLRLR
jgi:hypothetical protein